MAFCDAEAKTDDVCRAADCSGAARADATGPSAVGGRAHVVKKDQNCFLLQRFRRNRPSRRPVKEAEVVLFCQSPENYNIFVVIYPGFARFYNVAPKTPAQKAQSPRKRCRFLISAAKSTTFTIKWERAAARQPRQQARKTSGGLGKRPGLSTI